MSCRFDFASSREPVAVGDAVWPVLLGAVAIALCACGIDRPPPADGGDDGPTPACQNRIRDLDETDVDCGGPCGPCEDGARCLKDADCRSGRCGGDHCALDFFVDAARGFEAGPFPTGVVIAEVNGDGKPDVLVSLQNDLSFAMSLPHLAVLPGAGDATLRAPQTFVTPGFPARLAAGDLSGDKLADVALPDQFSDQVAILLADGAGGFRKSYNVTGLSSTEDIAMGDFNGDGLLDLVVAGSRVVLLPGDGTGRFGAPLSLPLPGRAVRVAVADWNGDKRDDLAVSSEFGGLSIFLGQALVGLRVGAAVPTFDGGSIVAGDLNHDGKPDLAGVDQQSGAVLLLLGKGDGTFARGTSPAGEVPGNALVAAADFNGDGVLDVATADAGGRARLFLGQGGGTLADGTAWHVGTAPTGLAAADLDGDGRADLVAANAETDDVTVLPGRADGSFPDVGLIPDVEGPLTLLATDLDGDGRDDLVTGSNGNGLEARLSKGDGTFGAPAAFWLGGLPDSLLAADLDGDQRPEVVTAVRASRQVTVLKNDGKGALAPGSPVDTSGDPTGLAAGDLDGDGKRDLVVIDHATGDVRVLYQRGAGFQHIEPIKAGQGAFAASLCDLDGDGKLDILVSLSGSGRKSLAVLLARGEMAFGPAVTYPFGSFDANASASAVVCRDLDGRGRPEVVAIDAISAVEKNVSILSVQEGGVLKTIENDFAGAALTSLAVGALHPGGRMHVLVSGPRGVGLLFGDGSARFQPVVTYRPGGASFGAIFGDFDGDRRSDVAAIIEGFPTRIALLRNRRP